MAKKYGLDYGIRYSDRRLLKKKIDKATYNALLAKYPDADETEIKLMVKGNAKKLYKYGLDNYF